MKIVLTRGEYTVAYTEKELRRMRWDALMAVRIGGEKPKKGDQKWTSCTARWGTWSWRS